MKYCSLFYQDISEYKCESGKSPLYVPHKPVTGVIGASFSGVSIMVANILRLFKVCFDEIFFAIMDNLYVIISEYNHLFRFNITQNIFGRFGFSEASRLGYKIC